jgi:glycine/D-amino acid oxidase-like deaminating enzyme
MIGNAAITILVVPALGKIPIIRSWVGFDGRSADKAPIIGDIPGNPGAYLATSCSGAGGYTIGPLVGRLIAEKICTGASSIPIDEFNVSRYGREIKVTSF